MARILVVEDDADFRSMIRLILEKEDYVVYTAENTKTALEVLNQESVDLVLTDFFMHGETAKDLCVEINSKYNIPVIIMTGLKDHEQLSEVKAHDMLIKPFGSSLLREAIQRHLGRVL